MYEIGRHTLTVEDTESWFVVGRDIGDEIIASLSASVNLPAYHMKPLVGMRLPVIKRVDGMGLTVASLGDGTRVYAWLPEPPAESYEGQR